MILGSLDLRGIGEAEDTQLYREDKKLWLSLTKVGSNFTLKELSICGEKYTPKQHYVVYPKMKPGQFISLSSLTYDCIMKGSKTWVKSDPFIEKSELSRQHNLTDNDIAIR